MKRGRSLGFVVVYTPPKGHAVAVFGLGEVQGVLMDKVQAERAAHALQAERKDPFYQIAELVLPSEPEVEI